MNNELLNDQVNTIRQAFGYVKRFNGELFVIKIESSLMQHPLFPTLMRDIVRLHDAGIKIILIPEARERINEVLENFNIATDTINGIRISTEEAIPFIKMAAFDVSNKIMTDLAENSASAVIGNWVRARSIGVKDGIDFHSTGAIDKIDTKAILNVLDDNMIPIFPNIGWSRTGKPYNISSNELALNVSSTLKARKLFFVTAYDFIPDENLIIPETILRSDDGRITQLTVTEAEHLLKVNTDTPITPNSYLHLIKNSCEAAKAGVQRVHIIDGRRDGMLLKEIFSSLGFGTMIYTNEHENIRPTSHTDIPEIMRITAPLIEKNILVHRNQQQLEETLGDYVIYEVDDTVHGCGALKLYANNVGEIYSIAVDGTYASMGTGSRIISFLIHKAIKLKQEQLFLLTTQTTDWFLEQGFQNGEVIDLPHEKQETYNWDRKSRILTLDLTDETVISRFSQRA